MSCPVSKNKKSLIVEYITSLDVEDIYATSRLAHLGQKRRSGEDYFMHPKGVANLVRKFYPKDTHAYLVALLHDTLEDAEKVGNISRKDLEAMISASFSDQKEYEKVISAVRDVTHEKTQSYDEYVLSLASKPLALRVKLADMLHNLSSNPSERQKEKYSNALSLLTHNFSKTPAGISNQHIQALKNIISKKEPGMSETKTIRRFIREVFQSHTVEPNIGDAVINVNPNCIHFKSQGVVRSVDDLDDDQGKVIVYITTNDGDNWASGDVLAKTPDQLEMLK